MKTRDTFSYWPSSNSSLSNDLFSRYSLEVTFRLFTRENSVTECELALCHCIKSRHGKKELTCFGYWNYNVDNAINFVHGQSNQSFRLQNRGTCDFTVFRDNYYSVVRSIVARSICRSLNFDYFRWTRREIERRLIVKIVLLWMLNWMVFDQFVNLSCLFNLCCRRIVCIKYFTIKT